MKAVLSDVHGNLEALQAVLADIQRQGAQEVYCLGDLVGYGPNPIECIDRARGWKLVLTGNHDQAALFDPVGWSPAAERAIYWVRDLLERGPGSSAAREERFEFLGTMPRKYLEGDTLFVHGSPRNPINEYVFPEDIYNPRKMERLFSLVPGRCFQGHTHVPGVFLEEGGDSYQFLSPEEIDHTWTFDGRKTMVNVGSVGQPRDANWRACYVLWDGNTIRFRRVEYDVETTVQKIHAIPELDNFLGDRLREGR